MVLLPTIERTLQGGDGEPLRTRLGSHGGSGITFLKEGETRQQREVDEREACTAATIVVAGTAGQLLHADRASGDAALTPHYFHPWAHRALSSVAPYGTSTIRAATFGGASSIAGRAAMGVVSRPLCVAKNPWSALRDVFAVAYSTGHIAVFAAQIGAAPLLVLPPTGANSAEERAVAKSATVCFSRFCHPHPLPRSEMKFAHAHPSFPYPFQTFQM
jgi:hypothetical protein